MYNIGMVQPFEESEPLASVAFITWLLSSKNQVLVTKSSIFIIFKITQKPIKLQNYSALDEKLPDFPNMPWMAFLFVYNIS